ncbi:MAG: adenylyl-sulfate kinase [Gemmatimonadetes bacterium]|nr:adenylyl-sulfate kinase [Gemmatimonadota bacterium]
MSDQKDSAERKRSENVTWHDSAVTREAREERRGHRGAVLWFTGLSASGKSTLAVEVEKRLFAHGYFSYVLDGDNIRHGLNGDLGFTPDDRMENIRRVGEVAKLFAESGALVLTAFISPYRRDRDRVRSLVNRPTDFVEIHVSCPVEVCEARDPKGLYKKARAGEIPNFTGIDAPYELPEVAELTVETNIHDVDACAEQVMEFLRDNGYISNEPRLHAVGG